VGLNSAREGDVNARTEQGLDLKCYWVLAIFLTLSTATHAQNNATDISGTWQINIAKSKFPKVPNKFPLNRVSKLVIICTADTIQMRYSFGKQVITRTYTPDGKEQIMNQGRDSYIAVTTRWKKGVLTIEHSGRAYMPFDRWSQGTEVFQDTERWSLSPDGKTLTRLEDAPRSVSVFEGVRCVGLPTNLDSQGLVF
jgi:hypothetical protein